AEAVSQLLGRLAGDREVGLERGPAAVGRAKHPGQQLVRARVDERGRGLDAGRLDEAVDGGRAELGLELRLELLAQTPFDVGAQLGERVELARGAREVVV